MNNLDAVVVDIDDFCQTFLPAWKKHFISSSFKQRNKPFRLSVSGVMTIVIVFHQSGIKTSKPITSTLFAADSPTNFLN
ncbi:hypothetical protein BTN49_1570 [Candidatus Enterovibrio escicola]|uniref:Mobile element protein n=1 Tax=Candidatus Enterovibrio escicola TaxID=1927127 RepID=A0A2A5T3Q4_9GAMM|nr:hypothetical protein [Candidatus Enterovibrio escacola]PCS22784.1 hypothetical protein BTN49_1570 [Candidatus Enterovibrio escacola]